MQSVSGDGVECPPQQGTHEVNPFSAIVLRSQDRAALLHPES